MAYDGNTQKISAPVSVHDVQQALGSTNSDVGTLCKDNTINKWAKYKPVFLSAIDTITGQWNAALSRWLSAATWWRGDRTSGQVYRRECGFQIPSVDYATDYRSQIYYYDNTAAPGVYSAPANIPNGEWQRLQPTTYRLADFALYKHTGPIIPLQMAWPSAPIVLAQNDTGFSFSLIINNYASRTNGTDEAIFANDMEEPSGATICAKLTVVRYVNNTYYDTRYYEVEGSALSDNSGNISITIMRKLLQRMAVEVPHIDMVTIEPYLRKMTDNKPRLLSIGCENGQAQTIRVIFPGSSYKMRFMVGEVTDSVISGMFAAGFTSSLAGRTIRPVVGDVVECQTTGHWLRVGGLFAKAIINDVYNIGALTGTFTVRVYIEDLNCDDYNLCIIPKTQILSFTVSDTYGLQGYGYRGSSSMPSSVGNTTLEFADDWNAENANWDFGFYGDMVPILEAYGADEVWPPGPLNPDNNVVAKFRITCEIDSAGGHTVFSVPQNGDGSYHKTDPSYRPWESMSYWKTGYIFDVIQDGEGGYAVIEDPPCCGFMWSRDSGEVADDLGTSQWMPLPQGWSEPGSTWLTE